jgi:hypothetical protein
LIVKGGEGMMLCEGEKEKILELPDLFISRLMELNKQIVTKLVRCIELSYIWLAWALMAC